MTPPAQVARTAAGAATQVLPGVWRLAVSLPGHSIGHVNAYALLRPEGGALLVDTGYSSAAPHLEELLQRVGIGPGDVVGVLLTHLHADHCGLAARFQRSGAWTAMHAADARLLDQRYVRREPYVVATREWLVAAGAPSQAHAPAESSIRALAQQIEPFVPDRLLEHGEAVTFGPWQLQVQHTPGHTPGSCCFHDRAAGVLFSGDHVFPRIRASPGFRPQADADPVGDYLGSLDQLERLEVSTVLPGHQDPFGALAARVADLRRYHRARMAEIHRLVRGSGAGGATVWGVAAGLGRAGGWEDRPWTARIAALAETYAHLIRLREEGVVASSGGGPTRWTAGVG